MFNILKSTIKKIIPWKATVHISKFIELLHSINNKKKFLHIFWKNYIYSKYYDRELQKMFLATSAHLWNNRILKGYYFEFGCFSGKTMTFAWNTLRHRFDYEYIAFDSFEGMPKTEASINKGIWNQGTLYTDEKTFIDICQKSGLRPPILQTVPGLYENSLTLNRKNKFKQLHAAVIYIDCIFLESAKSVFDWIPDFIKEGTVIILHGWTCYNANHEQGVLGAFHYFQNKYVKFTFTEFQKNPYQIAYICTSCN